METKTFSKVAPKFYCKKCDYGTSKKSSINKHNMTSYHNMETNGNKKLPNSCSKFECMNCKKLYINRSGLWKHNQKCIGKNNNNENINVENTKLETNKIDNNLIVELLKQNQEFKEQIMELVKKDMVGTTNNNINNTINNTTNKFNMNFFLNEQCKGALDIMDFISSLKVQLDDLENTGKVGYVNGITKIFLRNLKELDVYKRPIHCSDLKREVMYVKDKNVWEKDDEKNKIKLAIRHVADKNFKQIQNWVKENPDAKDIETTKHEQYMKILSKCTGGIDNEQDNLFYNKIITNIAKEVQIDK